MVPTNRSASAFADRSADGSKTDGGEHLIEAPGELGVPVADQEAEVPPGLLHIGGEVVGHLSHPWSVRVGGDTEDVQDAALDLDHEQHVEAAEKDRVDVEEVCCHDPLGLGGEELRPGRTCPSRCWLEAVAAQDRSDARLRHDDAELLELPDNA
jgi:hypothetical protein